MAGEQHLSVDDMRAIIKYNRWQLTRLISADRRKRAEARIHAMERRLARADLAKGGA